MNAIEARALATSSRSSATTALITAIDAAIQETANKGNTKLCTKVLVSTYSTEVVMEVYSQLRTLGYKVNPLNCQVYWGN